jgi:hypothetical protein
MFAIVAVGSILTLLTVLRDPPWLLGTTTGFGGWESEAGGGRYRWMRGHASFFVPSDSRVVVVPLRTTFDAPSDWSVTASITIDDRPADRVVLSDPAWRRIVLGMPPRGGRRTRRIDIRVSRMRDDNRGAQVGEIEVR